MRTLKPTGNQYISRRRWLLGYLKAARAWLAHGEVSVARGWLAVFRAEYAKVPASTRRRWRCGR